MVGVGFLAFVARCCRLFVGHGSLVDCCCLVIVARCSLFCFRSSLFAIGCWLRVVRCSLIVALGVALAVVRLMFVVVWSWFVACCCFPWLVVRV